MAEKIKELCHTYSPHFLSLLILSTSCLYFSRMLTNSPSSRLAYLADLEIYHEASQSEIHNAYKRLRLVHQLRRDKEQISQVQHEERMARIEQGLSLLIHWQSYYKVNILYCMYILCSIRCEYFV